MTRLRFLLVALAVTYLLVGVTFAWTATSLLLASTHR